MGIVVLLELVECLAEMALVPDESPIEEFVAERLHPPLHSRIHSRRLDAAEDDLYASVGEYLVEELRELRVAVARIMYLALAPASCRSITRFFAVWATQPAVGCAVVPRIRTRRLSARNLLMSLDDTRTAGIRYLIRDNAGYFTEGFDSVFTAVGARVVPILPGVPRMNAITERWVGSCRREATDRVLITGERHLRLVVEEYADHHNEHRPHRSLGQRCPNGVGAPEPPAIDAASRILRRDRLDGLIHEYAQVV
ncbi:integrase core domain-containing protein [Streptomyces sp. NPDC054933]